MLAAKNLSKVYPSDRIGLKPLSFTCEPGITLIKGKSGCGKSTLLHLIAQFITPTSGTIHYKNQAYSSFTSAQHKHFLAFEVGISFQAPYIISGLNVSENIAMPLHIQALPETEIYNRVEKVSTALDITPLLKAIPNTLSGGQASRVSLARALAKNSPLLVLDEPTANLDDALAQTVSALIKKESETKTIIVTSHSLHFDLVADQVIHLET